MLKNQQMHFYTRMMMMMWMTLFNIVIVLQWYNRQFQAMAIGCHRVRAWGGGARVLLIVMLGVWPEMPFDRISIWQDTWYRTQTRIGRFYILHTNARCRHTARGGEMRARLRETERNQMGRSLHKMQSLLNKRMTFDHDSWTIWLYRLLHFPFLLKQ